jgi:nucleotide-binding universal stress UspA family protein
VKTILAPIDFSAVTPRVVADAAHLARMLDARLVLLNVSRPDSLADEPVSFHQMMEDLVEHPLDFNGSSPPSPSNDPPQRGPVAGDSLQLIGEPVDVILQQAKALAADYIIMGSHGHSALHDFVFGSVAAGVLRDAPCPIMIVPSRRVHPSKPAKRQSVEGAVHRHVD